MSLRILGSKYKSTNKMKLIRRLKALTIYLSRFGISACFMNIPVAKKIIRLRRLAILQRASNETGTNADSADGSSRAAKIMPGMYKIAATRLSNLFTRSMYELFEQIPHDSARNMTAKSLTKKLICKTNELPVEIHGNNFHGSEEETKHTFSSDAFCPAKTPAEPNRQINHSKNINSIASEIKSTVRLIPEFNQIKRKNNSKFTNINRSALSSRALRNLFFAIYRPQSIMPVQCAGSLNINFSEPPVRLFPYKHISDICFNVI